MFQKAVFLAFVMTTPVIFSQVTNNISITPAPEKEAESYSDRIIVSDSRYIGMETGIGRSTYRDFGTSPLFYNGLPVSFKLSFLKESRIKERSFYLQYAFGNYKSAGNYINRSRVNSFFADYSKLYMFPALSRGKWNTMLGAKINLTNNVRNNPSLQNNAYGVEFFANVMASIQVRRNLSRYDVNPKKFLFINYGRKMKNRAISARFNAGLLNMNYRNGFIYTQQYNVVNKVEIFENYKFHINGLRFGSTIAFTRIFPQGNGMRWSYNWDAYSTSYKFEGFDMAHHTLTFALLFRTK